MVLVVAGIIRKLSIITEASKCLVKKSNGQKSNGTAGHCLKIKIPQNIKFCGI